MEIYAQSGVYIVHCKFANATSTTIETSSRHTMIPLWQSYSGYNKNKPYAEPFTVFRKLFCVSLEVRLDKKKHIPKTYTYYTVD